MTGQGKVKISQCMIVKDEEKNIERALSWGKGIVSEQIVVDTGSSDRTVEIAERMGAKVYHFPWIDDFAAAKNYAIDQAQGDWIAFLDADEYFSEEDARKVRDYIEELHKTDAGAFMTGWINLNQAGEIMTVMSQIRVFRNMPDLRYKGRIHEYLELEDGKSLEVVDLVDELNICHSGYEERELKEKEGRNLRLILAELQEHPEDYRMLGYLGKEYMVTEEYDKAVKAFRQAIAQIPEEAKGFYDGTTSEILLRLLVILKADPKTDPSAVMEVYEQAVRDWPEDADYDYIMGQYLTDRDHYPEGEKHLRQALQKLEDFGHAGKAILLTGNLMDAYEYLALCCYKNGKLSDCVSVSTAVLREEPKRMGAAVLYLSAFAEDARRTGKGEDNARDVAAFLGKTFYDFGRLEDRQFVQSAAKAAGYPELVRVMEEERLY